MTPRYGLRTLLIVLALGPPVLAGAWWGWQRWRDSQRVERQPAIRVLPQAMDFPLRSESDQEFSFFFGSTK